MDMKEFRFQWTDLRDVLNAEEPGRYNNAAVKIMTLTLNMTKNTHSIQDAVKAMFEDLYKGEFLPVGYDFERNNCRVRRWTNLMIKVENGVTKVLPDPARCLMLQEGNIEILLPNKRTKVFHVLVAKAGYIERITVRLMEIATKKEEENGTADNE